MCVPRGAHAGLQHDPKNAALLAGAEGARKARTPASTPARAADAKATDAGAGSGSGEGGEAAAPGGKTQADLDLEALFGLAEEVEQKKYSRKKETSKQPPVDLGTRESQIGECGCAAKTPQLCTWLRQRCLPCRTDPAAQLQVD